MEPGLAIQLSQMTACSKKLLASMRVSGKLIENGHSLLLFTRPQRNMGRQESVRWEERLKIQRRMTSAKCLFVCLFS